MRKTSKAWLIVGLLLILVGGLLFVGELASGFDIVIHLVVQTAFQFCTHTCQLLGIE